MEHGGGRSYLDALSNYERITTEAIALARRNGSHVRISQHKPRDLDSLEGPEPDAIAEVMLRWHFSLMAVLKKGQQMFQQPLELALEHTDPHVP